MSGPWKVTATGSGAKAPDREECRRALALLADPEGVVQLQALPSGRWEQLPGGDLDRLADTAARLADGEAVYYLLNPLPARLYRAARSADVRVRRWLLIDVDRVKDEATKNLSASDAEKEASRAVAGRIHEHLSGLGWPAPVLVDSGNGYHLLYRLDLPADRLAQALVRGCLEALRARFDTAQAEVDRRTHDARRCAKLPGTWALKGPDTPERPHRLCRLLSAPDRPEPVPVGLLQALAAAAVPAAPAAAPAPPAPAGPWNVRAGAGAVPGAYGRSALEREAGKVALAAPGDRNNQLFRSAAAIGELVAGGEVTRAEAEQALTLAAERCGLCADPTCGPGGVAATVASGLDKGATQPRRAPERDGASNPGRQPRRAFTPPAQETDGPVIVRASEITPRKVEWLWPGRIPLGKLTTFAGVGGLGKTFVLCDITARVTRGSEWPFSGGECAERGQVLFVSGEDEPDDTLVPRLIELGADLERVTFLTTEAQDRFTLADLKMLDRAVEQTGDGVRFVAIDPPTAYLGGVDDHKNSELRGLLSPLKTWAARRKLALTFNTHVNKPQGAKVEAMMRVMGSVAWVNAVRAAHMFARDPHDPERRLFVGMKLNIGKERKGLAYRIVSTSDDLAKIEWLGEVDTTADEAVNRDTTPKKRRVAAADWLAEVFSESPELPSKEVFKRKDRETSLSNDALKEAKEDMGIRAVKKTDDEGHSCWFWSWPTSAREAWCRAKAKADDELEGGQDEVAL